MAERDWTPLEKSNTQGNILLGSLKVGAFTGRAFF